MDEGNYTAAETAYRKMMRHDSGFLIGLCLLGRITPDSAERKEILAKLEKRKSGVKGDEKLLFDVFFNLIKLTYLREAEPDKTEDMLETIFRLAEENLKIIAHKYPNETYYKAEYIEVLNRNHGPRMALDSLYILASNQQQNQPFLLGYAATMEAEVGQYDKALANAEKLLHSIGSQSPKPYVVYSDIYFKMDNFEKARSHVIDALKIDPGNLEAQRLQSKIQTKIKD